MKNQHLLSISDVKNIFSYFSKEKSLNKYSYYANNCKEKEPTYSLVNVDFNFTTRVTRIEILQTQQYRTIERYVTQNYQKHPIYSNWKSKQKTINKTIKLTNSELEVLNQNKDALIKLFAEEIIMNLNNEELFPSWFIKSMLKKQLDIFLELINHDLELFLRDQNHEIEKEKAKINKKNHRINILQFDLKRQERNKKRLILKLEKFSNKRFYILKSIFTLGFYGFAFSQRKKKKLESRINLCENTICNINKTISELNNQVNDSNSRISVYDNESNNRQKEATNEINLLINDYNSKIKRIEPLPLGVTKDSNFMMLKYFNGLEYEKIIGVYIIHNKEKGKYYVGQSKDVMKRIKQHFNGTTPKNSIFAEDYYTSNLDNKEDIFELKIIKCTSKDELDRTEKNLIYQYDSYNNGYNGTQGNI